MKKAAARKLNQPIAPEVSGTDFYDLTLPIHALSEEQLQDRPVVGLIPMFMWILAGRTQAQITSAAAELKRVSTPFQGASWLNTRFRALLYVLKDADLNSVKGLPAAKESDLVAVLGLLLLQEYVQLLDSKTSGQQAKGSLKECEAQIVEAWTCASNMLNIKKRADEACLVYGADANSKYKSVNVQNRINATQKNVPFRDLEGEVVKRFKEGRKTGGHPIWGKWRSAKQAGERIYQDMKDEHDKRAELEKRSGAKSANFPLVDSNAADQFSVYIRKFRRWEKACDELAKLGLPPTLFPELNSFIPPKKS